MDVNEFDGKMNVLTKAIYDPFQSYYYYQPSKKGSAFINMYFDLVEMNRRTLQKDVSDPNMTKDQIMEAYNRHLKESEVLYSSFFKDVDRLENEPASEEWNALIKNELGIDNLTLFQIDFSE